MIDFPSLFLAPVRLHSCAAFIRERHSARMLHREGARASARAWAPERGARTAGCRRGQRPRCDPAWRPAWPSLSAAAKGGRAARERKEATTPCFSGEAAGSLPRRARAHTLSHTHAHARAHTLTHTPWCGAREGNHVVLGRPAESARRRRPAVGEGSERPLSGRSGVGLPSSPGSALGRNGVNLSLSSRCPGSGRGGGTSVQRTSEADCFSGIMKTKWRDG